MANIRIIYANKATQVGGSSSALSLNDYKSQTQAGSSFSVTTNALSGPVGVVAVLANKVDNVTMSVSGGISGSKSDSTTSNINTSPQVGYGGTKYLAVYGTASGATSFNISFSSSVSVSKFIIGNYWSPTHNIGYGISVGYNDTSTIERLQTGDQYVTNQPRNKTLQFDLQYLNEQDKFELFDIIRVGGKLNPIFVSAFPNDSLVDKEQMYSIYGRAANLANISHYTYTMYSSQLQLEEF